MNYLTLPAVAKLNLFLRITGRRADNYHNIQTVFQLINFSEELTFTKRTDKTIRLITEIINIPSENNLITKAAKLLQKTSGCSLGCDITINKKIPLGAGLGGGSSNAATTLLALNTLWNLQLSHTQLIPLARALGADVPLFLHGQSAWAEGIGDILTPFILRPKWYVIVIPKCHVSTTTIFQDPTLNRQQAVIGMDNFSQDNGNNCFEAIVLKRYPEVKAAFDYIGQHTRARLTGTGSAVFATFDSEHKAGKMGALTKQNWKTIVTQGLNHSPVHAKLSTI